MYGKDNNFSTTEAYETLARLKRDAKVFRSRASAPEVNAGNLRRTGWIRWSGISRRQLDSADKRANCEPARPAIQTPMRHVPRYEFSHDLEEELALGEPGLRAAFLDATLHGVRRFGGFPRRIGGRHAR